MKTINLTLHLEEDVFERVAAEATRRSQTLEDVFRAAIIHALLPTLAGSEMERVLGETWEKLGPPPEIDYDKLHLDPSHTRGSLVP